MWIEVRPMELVDSLIEKPVNTSELLKCIHVGLMCVQHRPEDRPTISTVVAILDGDNPILAQPKLPGFFAARFLKGTDSSSTGRNSSTPNEVTITVLHGRWEFASALIVCVLYCILLL